MHKGSKTDLVSRLEPGESILIPTTLETYPNEMRTWSIPHSRRPEFMKGWVIQAKLYTMVGVKAGDIKYCVEITRLA